MTSNKRQRWTHFGLLGSLAAAAGLCVGLYVYYYSHDSFIEDKTSDAETMWSLTSSFVSTYSTIRGAHNTEMAPVPAEFRAQAIDGFNAKRKDNVDEFWSALMVGVPGKEIATLPSDAIVANRLLRMSESGQFLKYDQELEVSGQPILRSVFPSVATKQSCVDCHNEIQAGKHDWKVGELMGAFVLDRNIGDALTKMRRLAIIAGLMSTFLVLLVGIPLIRMRSNQQAAAELLVGALDAIDDPFIVYDDKEKLTLFNRAFADNACLDSDGLRPGISFADVQRTLYQEGDETGFVAWLEERRNQIREWAESDQVNIVANDSGDWYRHTVRKLSSGHVIELRSDITELKLREHELERSRSRLQQSETQARRLALVAEHANDAIIITDTEGQAIWINTAFTELTGFDASELLGHKPGPLLQGVDTDQDVVAAVSNAVRQGEQIRCELLNYAKDKTPYWVEIDISPVYADTGELQNFIGVERDVTEKKQFESDLEQSRVKAEAASRSKSIFLANMSHEIRTPMNGVIATAELLLDTDLNAEQRQYAHTVYHSGSSLLTIINDVLDFSKIEAGRMELDPVGFDLRSALGDVVSLVKTGASEKGLAVDLVYADDLPDHFVGDVGRIRQIVTNLAGNAVKFTLEGSVTVRVDGGRDPHSDEDRYALQIAIEDTGIGIPDDKLNSIFGQFEQVNGETNREFEGTGLGLSISLRLVELMEGSLHVTSTLGQGSTFVANLSLPLYQKQELDTDNASQQSVGQDRRSDVIHASTFKDTGNISRLLIAEDNKTNQFVIRKMLSNIGDFEIEIADNGQIAAEKFPQYQPDIILMDISMPIMNGFEATAAIRSHELANGLARCPIVALTANAMQGDREKCIQAGMDDYLTKPVSKESLLKMIKTWSAMGGRGANAA